MKKHKGIQYILCFLYFILYISPVTAQNTTEPHNGVYQKEHTYYAIVNATIYINSEEKIEHATLLFKNGIIEKIGKIVTLPKNTIKIDMKGYTLYPSFIDPFSNMGMPKPMSKKTDFTPQINSLKDGPYYWNEAIHPEVNAYELYDEKLATDKKKLIQQGFGIVSTHQNDGIMRGTSTILTLGDKTAGENTILAKGANYYSFKKGVSRQTYPSSQMGCIALIRQFFYDLHWYQQIDIKNKDNISFQSTLNNKELPHIFDVADKLEILRVNKIAKEFEIPFIVKGGGDEYQRINEIKKTKAPLIVPVNFPKPFDLTDPFISRYINLSALKHWEMAPYNPYILYKNGIEFSFTTEGLKSQDEFLNNVKKAVKHGLPKSQALKSLTQIPAKYLNIDEITGTLEEGKLANFIVVKGDLFTDGEIYENWIRGEKNEIKDKNQIDIRGKYDFNVDNIVYPVEIKGSPEKPSGTISSFYLKTDSVTKVTKMDTLQAKMDIKHENLQVSISFLVKDNVNQGVIQLNGSYHPELGIFDGNALLPNGNWVKWNGIKGKFPDDKKVTKDFQIDTSSVTRTFYPNMSFGFDSLPKQQTFFIKNATIWTNEEEGIIREGNLLIENGKIKAVNKKTLKIPNDAIVIDATGKHVTCGIIDEHSHISISKGVNEGGQSNSAEVSIADVVRSNDINVYRQLAGGVTCSQLLHGSANPIGGQSALIKLKWGFSPEEMLIKDQPKFIKFALGENVKQANWGDFNRIRFPQTRMGVEQVFYDAFTRAKLYKKEWEDYKKLGEKKKRGVEPPRRDLEMEVILEILEGERFITCHSYVQSEINMLMHVGDSMGFTVNTFTHILEGYKVADKMKKHGAGASTFSDWWAYKFEVNDAIPYNAAILQKMGIVTALNSDDAEMGRRLNQEAGKIVKYGGISEQEAWKMVTLNPAILLHLDDKMGSIKEGKDADIVIWSDNPLSINAKVEKTIIEGVLFYDIERNELLKKRDELERKRIFQLMIDAKNNGEQTERPMMRKERHYHCDTMEGEEFYNEHDHGHSH